MIGLLLAVVVNLFAHFNIGYSASDAFIFTMSFLTSYYLFCFIAGAIAKIIASRGNKERAKVNSLLNLIGYSYSACILAQSWRHYIATEALFVGSASLWLGSRRFGATFVDFNCWMLLGGILMFISAIVAQRIAVRKLTRDY